MLTIPTLTFRSMTSTELLITSGGYRWENETVNFEIIQMSDTELVIGPAVKRYLFEYKPNPMLEDISPRKTILR